MPRPSFLQKLDTWIVQKLYYPGDDDETIAIKKRFWAFVAPSPAFMTFWGLFFWLLGVRKYAMAMWLFGAISLLILLVFIKVRKHVKRFAAITLYFYLFFSFGAVLYFGGVLYSGGVVFVGLAGAIASLSFFNPVQFRIIFYVYFLSVIIEALLQPLLNPIPELTPPINLFLFILHLLVIAGVMLNTLSGYIQQSIAAKQEEADRLQELDKLKTNFYTNITHEFRTPLTVILGMIDQIAEKPKKYLQSGLQLIRQNSNRLLHLVNQMLSLAKLEAGIMSLHLIQSDILSYLRHLAEPFGYIAEKKNIHLHIVSDLDVMKMDFDPEKIQSLVENLLSNAIKHSPEGSDVYLQVSLVHKLPRPEKGVFCIISEKRNLSYDNWLLLKIKDTGHGIPENFVNRIFDRFYQLRTTNNHLDTEKAKSTGIGLSLVKELVKLMNGNLYVKTSPGQGTEFDIYLPVSYDAPLEEPSQQTYSSREVTKASTQTNQEKTSKWLPLSNLPLLLVVEDNPDVVQYIRAVLETNYLIEVASNGEEGLKIALARIPDIIISDVMMPKMDGFELCKQLKNDFRTSHIPIILLTAKADIASKVEGLELGADAYLTKPFHKDELLVRLRKLIEMRKALQQRYATGIKVQPSQDQTIQREDEFIKKVRRIVEENLDNENFGVPQLSQLLTMSRAQLYRKFNALTDQPVGKYIRTLRLNKAKALLQHSSLNVTEVAFEVGFRSLSHFSSAFKEEFGISPSEIS